MRNGQSRSRAQLGDEMATSASTSAAPAASSSSSWSSRLYAGSVASGRFVQSDGWHIEFERSPGTARSKSSAAETPEPPGLAVTAGGRRKREPGFSCLARAPLGRLSTRFRLAGPRCEPWRRQRRDPSAMTGADLREIRRLGLSRLTNTSAISHDGRDSDRLRKTREESARGRYHQRGLRCASGPNKLKRRRVVRVFVACKLAEQAQRACTGGAKDDEIDSATEPPDAAARRRAKAVLAYSVEHLPPFDAAFYGAARRDLTKISEIVTVPPRDGRAFSVPAGHFFRIVSVEGPQVGDLNLWNEHDLSERFFSGKTRALHATHVSTGDRLWSNLPSLRPIATITHDTLDGTGWTTTARRARRYRHAMRSLHQRAFEGGRIPSLLPFELDARACGGAKLAADAKPNPMCTTC